MDGLAALALQVEWGADEALAERPLDRRSALLPPASAPRPPTAAAVATPSGTATPLAQAQALAAGAADLPALRAALAGFDGCALRATATNLVFAAGEPSAAVTFVADVPGPAEDRAGVPFAGAAGAFLDRMLASIGLDRQHVYAASLIPWRPPGDRKPSEAEIQLCLPFFLRHLALVRPRRLLLMGALPARVLLPAAGARRGRGVWHTVELPGLAVPALALASLTAIQTMPAAKRESWADLLRLRRALERDLFDHAP